MVYDEAGTPYVDAMASLWHCNVGHARREVVDAVGWPEHVVFQSWAQGRDGTRLVASLSPGPGTDIAALGADHLLDQLALELNPARFVRERGPLP